METNQGKVEIALSDYLSLYEFEKSVKNGKSILVKEIQLRYSTNYYYYTESKAIEEISKVNERMASEMKEIIEIQDKLKAAHEHLNSSYKSLKKDLKGFSVWQFLKWKRNG